MYINELETVYKELRHYGEVFNDLEYKSINCRLLYIHYKEVNYMVTLYHGEVNSIAIMKEVSIK